MIDQVAGVVAVADMAVAGAVAGVVAVAAAVVVDLDAVVTTSSIPVNPSTTRTPPCCADS